MSLLFMLFFKVYLNFINNIIISVHSQLTQNISELEEMMMCIFQGMFVQRYRLVALMLLKLFHFGLAEV